MAYPLSFAPVATVVVGMASPVEVDENAALIGASLPDGLWDHLGLPVP